MSTSPTPASAPREDAPPERSFSDEDLLAGLHSVAREHLDFDGSLSRDTRLVEVLELDSLRLLTLVVELEDYFEVCLEEGDEDNIETVADLLGVLRRRLG